MSEKFRYTPEQQPSIREYSIEFLLTNYGPALAEMIRNESIEVFADTWPNQINHPKYIHPEMYSLYYQYFPQNSSQTVLDIGSGHKPTPVATVMGDLFVDSTSHRPPQAKIKTHDFVQFDARHLPFETNAFDMSVLSHVAEHLDPQELVAALAEATRVSDTLFIEVPGHTFEEEWGYYEHFYRVYKEEDMLIFDLKTEEEWIESLPKVLFTMSYRHHGKNPTLFKQYRLRTLNQYPELFYGAFVTKESLASQIQIVSRPGAITSRAQLEELKSYYLPQA